MSKLQNHNLIILSGAPGSGKTAILNKLKECGYNCINEPAREIIAEQIAINGEGLYNKNKKLFLELMLKKAVDNYEQCQNNQKPVIFDRGIPDLMGYAKLFNLNPNPALTAANNYRYYKKVFFLPSWQEIYITDEHRVITFEAAKEFGELIKQAYIALNYEIINVPLVDINERIKFIERIINLQP